MKTPWDVSAQVASFESYVTGLSMEEIQEKYGLKKVVKMASNENPYGVSPRVLQCIEQTASQSFRYPQACNPRLVDALASYFGKKYPYITRDRIFIGNGSDEIIDLLFRVRTVANEDNVVTFNPCFGMYITQAKFHGCELRQAPLNSDFTFNFDALLSLVDNKTSMVFVTNPDNPSGYLTFKDDLIRLAAALPKSCLLIIDEAYIEFAGNEDEVSLIAHLDSLPNVAIMRTFSKVYGLAGLRVGYSILPEQLAEYMWRVRLPFSTNIIAQEAAIVALEDENFKQKTIELSIIGRNKIGVGLKNLGCQVFPSASNFVMFQIPKGSMTAKEFNTKLLEKGYIIRSLAAYKLPDYLRVSVGTEEQNDEFLSLCESILNNLI